MYCVKCGVELADSEKKCPLCGTEVICPGEEKREISPPPYPPYPGAVREGVSRNGVLFVLTVLFLLPFCLCLICDIKINGGVVWSGYASGGILLIYVMSVLPVWFRRPNPVIFVPIDFAAIGLYLLYISCATGGQWFLSFAFPTVGCIGLIVTAVVALTRYTSGGDLFIYGGAMILLGGLSVLVEFFMKITFGTRMFLWSLYPLSAFFIIGMMLIVIGICRPLRESLKKKLFF